MGDAPEHTLRLIGLVFVGLGGLFGWVTLVRIKAFLRRVVTPGPRRLAPGELAVEPWDFFRELVAAVCCLVAGFSGLAFAGSLSGFEANDEPRIVGWLTYTGRVEHQNQFELEWVAPDGRLRFPKVVLSTPGDSVTLSYTLAKVKPTCVLVPATYLLKIDAIGGDFVGANRSVGIVGEGSRPVVRPLQGGRSAYAVRANLGTTWYPESVWLDAIEFREVNSGPLPDDPRSWAGLTWIVRATPSGLTLERYRGTRTPNQPQTQSN